MGGSAALDVESAISGHLCPSPCPCPSLSSCPAPPHPLAPAPLRSWKGCSVLCRGAIRTLMLTGDYFQTAIAVARGVGMLGPTAPLITVQAQSEIQSEVQSAAQGPDYSTIASGPSSSLAHMTSPAASSPIQDGNTRNTSTSNRAGSCSPDSLLTDVSEQSAVQEVLQPCMDDASVAKPFWQRRRCRVHPLMPSSLTNQLEPHSVQTAGLLCGAALCSALMQDGLTCCFWLCSDATCSDVLLF